MAAQQPVRLEFEDLHWADPSTLELLGLFIDQVARYRILVLLTFRPEFTPPWPTQAYMLPLQLSRLTQQQIAGMVERVAGKAVPEDLVQQLITKSDGVPLYVEEMTKNLLESGFLTEVNGHLEATGPLPQLAIPTTLQDSFASRLDRLAPVRELAQIGAVLGREFSYDLIRAVAQLDEATLQGGLQQLGAAEILYQRGVPPEASYSFKHALLQDASYESLLKSKRQQLHTQTAQVMEQQFPETVATHPELVAHHYTEASLAAQAIPYWQQAGQNAAQQFAHVEAISHFNRGIELLLTLPEDIERIQNELAFQIPLGLSLITTRGYNVQEVEHAYTRARHLCQQIGDTPQLQPVLHGLRVFYEVKGELQTTSEISKQLFKIAEQSSSQAFRHLAHGTSGELALYLGELSTAHEHFKQSDSLYYPHIHADLSFLWVDPQVTGLLTGAAVLWYLGYPDQALRRVQESVSLGREHAHPFSLAHAQCHAAWIHQLRGEARTGQEYAEAAITLSIENGFPNWISLGNILYGWALNLQGITEEGNARIREGMAGWQATGARLFQSFSLNLLAQGCRQVGRLEESQSVLDEALSYITKSSERFNEAELHRLQGELLLHQTQDNVPEAEGAFQKAIEVARRQEAKSLELRAATSLAQVWQQQGKESEAHQLLAPVYNWFTEGFDTQDLKDAKALLAALA